MDVIIIFLFLVEKDLFQKGLPKRQWILLSKLYSFIKESYDMIQGPVVIFSQVHND